MKIILLIILTFFCINPGHSQNQSLFVSTAGNDSNTGTFKKPLKSLSMAVEIMKEKLKNNPETKSFSIVLRGGTYYFDKTINFDSVFFSNIQTGISILPYKNEKVIFSGAKTIIGFERLTDKRILDRLPSEAREKIYSVNLKANGVTEFGQISMKGSAGMEFFFNNERMTLSRYPNNDWLLIADIPQTGDSLYNKGLDREKRFNNVPVGRHYGKINYSGNRPNQWSADNEIYMHGYWTWDWSDSYQKIKSIDTLNKEITISEPHHNYGYTKNQRYYFVNILEEMDIPGEWYLDRSKELLYFYAPTGPTKGIGEVSVLSQPFIILNSTNNITIENITFEKTRSNAIWIKGGNNNRVAGCDFRLIGDVVIEMHGGFKNGILSSNIYDVSLGGINLNAGDRTSLTPSGSYVRNCHIHDFSKWLATGNLGIRINGVGNILANNQINNAPFEAIYIMGNDHILEYNEIFNVCSETGDAGATHTGRNYTWRGNVYRYNYFHHLKGPGLHGVTAIYLDDFTSGYHVYGNICYKSGRGVLLGGGRDNIVENNIFIDCHPSIVLDARGLSWASYYFDGTYPYLFTTMNEMKSSMPLYIEKYPALKNIENDQPAVPKNNRISNNISFGGTWIELYDYFAYDFKKEITLENNLIADKEVCKRIKEDPKGWEPYFLNLDHSDGYKIFKNDDPEILAAFAKDRIIDSDPGFINYSKQDFRLKKNSLAFKLGFKPIPMDKIGLYKDGYRKSLPKKESKFDF